MTTTMPSGVLQLGSSPGGVLIVGELPLWPLDQGSKVHGCGMARGLMELGVPVRLASVRSTPIADAPDWLSRVLLQWPTASTADAAEFARGWSGCGRWLRERIAHHQGVEPDVLAGVLPLVRAVGPDAVVALGQHGPMILRGLHGAFPTLPAIWYAADDPAMFQLSCLRREGWAGRARLRMVALYALLERSFGAGVDGVVGVNPSDTRILARLSRIPHAATIPNGVDTAYYTPPAEPPESRPRSLVFWGRMDFEPNADAACWFARRIWPALRQRQPDATWSIVGKRPSPQVQRLHSMPGVLVTGETPDIRPHAHAATAVVLPMRCGGGIKNKLLEAAAMGRPIVASPRALQGLELPAGKPPPMHVCGREAQWIAAIEKLWTDRGHAEALGREARAWVLENHTWRGAAGRLLELIRAIDRTNTGAQPAHLRRAA